MSGFKNSLEIIVPGANKDRTVEIERHGVPSLDQQIIAVAHVLKGSSDPSTADDDGRGNFGSDGGCHGQGFGSARPDLDSKGETGSGFCEESRAKESDGVRHG